MTVHPMNGHRFVLVRARLLAEYSQHCSLGFPCDDQGNMTLLTLPHSEIFCRESTDAARNTIRELVERLHQIMPVAERAQLEVYELGGHAMTPTR